MGRTLNNGLPVMGEVGSLLFLSAGKPVPTGMVAVAFNPSLTIGDSDKGGKVVAKSEGWAEDVSDLIPPASADEGVSLRMYVARTKAAKKARTYHSPR